jgi:ketosteroid isomerase-like protein
MRLLALLLFLIAAPAAAARPAPASDRETVAALVRDLAAAISAKDRAAVARLSWPDGHYRVVLQPRTDPPRWFAMEWSRIGFPPDIDYRTTMSDVNVDTQGDRATITAQVTGLCYRGDTFTGVRLVSSNRIEAERRGGEWRVRDWSRDAHREGEGDC